MVGDGSSTSLLLSQPSTLKELSIRIVPVSCSAFGRSLFRKPARVINDIPVVKKQDTSQSSLDGTQGLLDTAGHPLFLDPISLGFPDVRILLGSSDL